MEPPTAEGPGQLPSAESPEIARRLRLVGSAQRPRFQNERRAIEFELAFEHVARHREYLELVLADYAAACAPYVESIRRQREWGLNEPDGTLDITRRPLTDAELAELVEQARLGLRVHLEIETFYLFASTVLDRAALAFRLTFGEARGVSIASHSTLQKNLDLFADGHGLSSVPEALKNAAAALEADIAPFRDWQVTHLTNPRVLQASGISPAGEVTINPFIVEPGPNEYYPPSRRLTELVAELDAYLSRLVDFIEANAEHIGFGRAEPTGAQTPSSP